MDIDKTVSKLKTPKGFFSIALFLISLSLLVLASQIKTRIDWDPLGIKFMPILYGILLTLLCLWGMIKEIVITKIQGNKERDTFNRKVIITIIVFFLYLLVVPLISYFIASLILIVFLVIFLSDFHKEMIWKAVLVGIGTTFSTYIIFVRVFNMFLP